MKSLYLGQLAGTSGPGLCNHISAQLHGHMTDGDQRTRAHTGAHVFVQQQDAITIPLNGHLAFHRGDSGRSGTERDLTWAPAEGAETAAVHAVWRLKRMCWL